MVETFNYYSFDHSKFACQTHYLGSQRHTLVWLAFHFAVKRPAMRTEELEHLGQRGQLLTGERFIRLLATRCEPTAYVNFPQFDSSQFGNRSINQSGPF